MRWIIFPLLLCLASAYAQPVAMFETVIHFEDAIGNRDSVVVGLDTAATLDLDAEFGEVEILTPFDSVFEVRAGSTAWQYEEKLTKRFINRAGFFLALDNCLVGGDNRIYIWAKYQPVKVWWDSTLFLNDPCFRGSHISDNWQDELAGPIGVDEFAPVYLCMAVEGQYEFYMTDSALVQPPARMTIEKEVEGLGLQTIYALRFWPNPVIGFTPCYWVTGTEETPPDQEALLPLKVFPNPGSGVFQFELPDGLGIEAIYIYDFQGNLLLASGQSRPELDMSEYPAGIYTAIVWGSDKRRYAGRLVIK